MKRTLSIVMWIALSAIRMPAANVNVLTQHNDRARTGQYLSETILTPSNVNSTSFGKLFQAKLDGVVDAQPLYVHGITIPNSGVHNLLIVATENDSIYALDADSGAVIWHTSFLHSGETASDNRGCSQVIPIIGVTSTPVIFLNQKGGGTIYAVAMSKDSSGNYHQRLHALSLLTGKPNHGQAVEVHATYPGTGANSNNGKVVFDPSQYKARPGLLFLNGVVYIGWSSHCDINPYTGWIMGYDASTLAQKYVLNVTPNGSEGAIWQAGAGIAADSSGNIYFLDANGTFDTTLNASGFTTQGDFGNAFTKLSIVGGKLAVSDYFNMSNTVSEANADEDLGSGGTLLLPDMKDSTGAVRRLAVGAGKDSNIYIVDRDNMGKFNAKNNNAIYQQVSGAIHNGVWSMPAYYNGYLYYASQNDHMRAFQFSQARLLSTPTSTTSVTFPYPGATPSISANGTTNGIVWAVQNGSSAVLYAYPANNLGTELYDSNQAAGSRDHFGAGNKFMTPTIANGKVYVGTPNGVAAFGLLGAASKK